MVPYYLCHMKALKGYYLEKDVLVKYGEFVHLCEGHRFQLYYSHFKGAVGEVTITQICYITPKDVKEVFGERIFLNNE